MSKEQLGRIVDRIIDSPRARRIIGKVFFHTAASGIKIEGLENIPSEGPAIIAINHMGLAEVFVPILFNPRRPKAMAKAETRKLPVIGSVLARAGTIFIRRGEVDRQALREANAVLERSDILVMAPEQTRGREKDGNRRQLKQAHGGVIFIAHKAASRLEKPVPIVPMAIWGGTEWFFPEIDDRDIPLRERLVWRREPVHVKVGKPINVELPEDLKGPMRREAFQTAVDKVMHSIRDLLPQEYHGFYAHNSPLG